MNTIQVIQAKENFSICVEVLFYQKHYNIINPFFFFQMDSFIFVFMQKMSLKLFPLPPQTTHRFKLPMAIKQQEK